MKTNQMKKIGLWVVVLLFWIGGASYWYLCKVREDCGCDDPSMHVDAENAQPQPLDNTEQFKAPSFQLESNDFSLSANEHLHFHHGKSEVFVPDDLKAKLPKLMSYINLGSLAFKSSGTKTSDLP